MNFLTSKLLIILLPPLLTVFIGLLAIANAPYLNLDIYTLQKKHLISNYDDVELIAIGEMKLFPYDLVDDFDQIKKKEDFFHYVEFQKYIANYIQKEKNISLSILDNGIKKSIVINAQKFPISHLLMELPLFLAAFFSIGIALILDRKAKKEIRINIFTLLLSITSTVFISYAFWSLRSLSLDPFSTLFMMIANAVSFIYFPLLFFHFFLIFPKKRVFATKKRFIIFLYSLPFFVLPIFSLRIFYEIQQLLFLFGIGGGIITMFWSFFHSSAIEKAQLKWILWGTMLFSLIMLLTYVLPTLGVFNELYSYKIPAIAFVLLPLTIAFAISKYKLMEINQLIDNTLIYILTFSLLSIIDFSLIYLINELTSNMLSNSSASLFALWFAIIFYVPLRNFLSKLVKKVLKRESYNSDQVALNLAKSIIPVDNVEILIKKVLQTLQDTMHPLSITPLLLNNNSNLAHNLKEFSFLHEHELFNVNAPLHLYQKYSEHSLPNMFTSGLIAPIIANSGNIGFLLIANKQNEQFYSKKDLNFIDMITSQMAIAIENLRAKEIIKTNKEQMIQEIHDGIGGIATNISLIAQMSTKTDTSAKLFSNLETVAELSKDAIFEIRTMLQSIDMSNTSYQELSSTLQRYSKTMLEPHNISFNFNESIETKTDHPNAVVTLNIFRIYREALTNIVKHSQAKHVFSTIYVTKEYIELSIEDDGVGLKNQKDGRGLANMQKRANAINATLQIKDKNGIQIKLHISLQQHEALL